jgi:benzoate/toluate 1,2-dioxygenase beta subunit
MTRVVDVDMLRAAEQFLYREARLCDEHRFSEWEALWTDDAIYWVPANGDHTDPTRHVSIVFDNRSRIATRIRQLESGKRHAQSPPSRLARHIGNVEMLADDGAELTVASVFTVRAGRYEHLLRRTPDGLRMVRKTARLIDNDRPIPTLAFLL